MKKRFLALIGVLVLLIVINLTHFSTNGQILALLIPNFRLPRLLTVLSAGIALSIAGFIIQSITENPLADSGTIGITSGASAGSAAFFQALITLGQLSVNAFDFQKVAVWLSGDIWQTGSTYLLICFILLLIGLSVLPFYFKKMEILALGEEMAVVLGIEVKKTKIQLYFLALLFASVGVLLVGGLAFVGLIAPHIAREIVGFRPRRRLVATALSGMIILCFADVVSQMIIAPSSLPLGFVVAFIGAPYYIYLIQKV